MSKKNKLMKVGDVLNLEQGSLVYSSIPSKFISSDGTDEAELTLLELGITLNSRRDSDVLRTALVYCGSYVVIDVSTTEDGAETETYVQAQKLNQFGKYDANGVLVSFYTEGNRAGLLKPKQRKITGRMEKKVVFESLEQDSLSLLSPELAHYFNEFDKAAQVLGAATAANSSVNQASLAYKKARENLILNIMQLE